MDEIYRSKYAGQTRIIPSDQLESAKQYLQGKIDRVPEGAYASEQIANYEETLMNLKDRLEAPDGTKSRPLTKAEAQAISELSLEGEFKPEDFGVTVSSAICPKYIFKEAMGTGLEVAAINGSSGLVVGGNHP